MRTLARRLKPTGTFKPHWTCTATYLHGKPGAYRRCIGESRGVVHLSHACKPNASIGARHSSAHWTRERGGCERGEKSEGIVKGGKEAGRVKHVKAVREGKGTKGVKGKCRELTSPACALRA